MKPQRNANPKESLNEILRNPEMNPEESPDETLIRFLYYLLVCILNETLKDPRWNLKKP